MSKQDLIVEYMNLLHRHRSPNAPKVLQFVKEHKQDAVFVRRVATLNRVWKLKA